MRVSEAAKAVVAAVGTAVTALSAAFADNILNDNETAGLVSTIVLAVLTVYGVYKTDNEPAE